jgi:nucleoside-diphosphate-sugar epimerase
LRLALEPAAAGPINLATGHARRVADVIHAIRVAVGHPLRATALDVNEPYEASCADVGLLRERLGWTPSTPLEDGISRLVAHERAALGG